MSEFTRSGCCPKCGSGDDWTGFTCYKCGYGVIDPEKPLLIAELRQTAEKLIDLIDKLEAKKND